MNIKINDFTPLSHLALMQVVGEYISKHEYDVKVTSYNEGFADIVSKDRRIKTTDKYPEIITHGFHNYHVQCNETKKSYVFTIWLAP